jgi:branched-chain amino acid transport system substrate-binding protein
MKGRAFVFAVGAIVAMALAANSAWAEKQYGPGVTDTEIKIGNIMPYSGPASAYGTIGKADAAYFEMINDKGGINGRKINFVTLDDGYSPPKTVEQARKLVEQERVLILFNPLGTPTNSAIHKYMNAKKVPHLFLSTGAGKWGQPKKFPWTMGWQPTYPVEGAIYAKYILQKIPDAKIGILFQNDDYGKDYVHGFKEGLGEEASKRIVSEMPYEVTDPTIDSQIVSLKNSGANVFFNVTTPKFAAQAIRKIYDIGWRPTHFLNSVSTSVGSVLTPAGLEKSVGIITSLYTKDPTDPNVQKTKAYADWAAWMDKYYPSGDKKDVNNVFGYNISMTLVHVLEKCGDNLTRENVMKQAASMKDVEIPMLLDGIKLNTGPDDFYPIQQEQLARFDGKGWVLFGEVISAE